MKLKYFIVIKTTKIFNIKKISFQIFNLEWINYDFKIIIFILTEIKKFFWFRKNFIMKFYTSVNIIMSKVSIIIKFFTVNLKNINIKNFKTIRILEYVS